MTTTNKEFKQEEVENLVLAALNLLCDDHSTMQDVRNLVLAKGYSEDETNMIVRKANGLYQNHFKDKTTTDAIELADIENMNSEVPVHESYSENYEEESSEFPSWIVWLVGLGVINFLSAMFDWPFWVY